MSELRAAAVAAVVTGVLVGGCTAETVTPGEPGTSPPPSTAGPQLPPRPEEIRIEGVDPCTLLNKQQQQQLDLDTEPRAGGGSSRGEAACSYDHSRSEPFYGVNIALVPFEGAEAWLTGGRNADVRLIDKIAGFGALEVQAIGNVDTSCNVVVDIADGQNVDVMFDGGGSGSFTVNEMCERARRAAEAATETLLAR